MASPSSPGRASRSPRSWLRRPRAVHDADDELIVAELYREYHRPLLAFCVRLTSGDRQWAEDVVQETMIRAWRNADQLTGRETSLMPWLATVARRIVIDNRRRREVRPPEVGEGPLESRGGSRTSGHCRAGRLAADLRRPARGDEPITSRCQGRHA